MFIAVMFIADHLRKTFFGERTYWQWSISEKSLHPPFRSSYPQWLQVHCGVQQRRATPSLSATKRYLWPVIHCWPWPQGQYSALSQPAGRGLAENGRAGPGWVSDESLPACPHKGAGDHTGTSWHWWDIEKPLFEGWHHSFMNEKSVKYISHRRALQPPKNR